MRFWMAKGGGGCYCTSWAEMRSSCRVLCYFQLSPLPTLPSHFPKHCFFTLLLPSSLLAHMKCSCSSASGRGLGEPLNERLPDSSQPRHETSRPSFVCVFSPFLNHSDLILDFALNLTFAPPSFFLPFSLSAWFSICLWWQRFYLSTSSHCQRISSRCPF